MALNRNVIALASVLALGAGYYFLSYRQSPEDTGAPAPAEPWRRFERGQITKVTIQKAGDTPAITLEKRGDAWVMTSPLPGPADRNAVNDVIEPAAEMRVGAVAARQAANHAALDIDAAHAVHLTLFKGDAQALDLLIGKSLDGGTAVRSPNDNTVFRVDRSLRFALERAAREFRDRDVVSVQRDRVRSVAWHTAAGTYAFDRNGDTWTAAAGSPAIARLDTAKVNATVANLIALRANDFAPANDAGGINPSGAEYVTITLDAEAGPPITLRAGNDAADNGVYIRRDGSDVVFNVGRSHKGEIALDVSLLQAPLPNPDGGTADAAAAAPPPAAVLPAPGGAGQGVPPEVMRQLQEQLRRQGVNIGH